MPVALASLSSRPLLTSHEEGTVTEEGWRGNWGCTNWEASSGTVHLCWIYFGVIFHHQVSPLGQFSLCGSSINEACSVLFRCPSNHLMLSWQSDWQLKNSMVYIRFSSLLNSHVFHFTAPYVLGWTNRATWCIDEVMMSGEQPVVSCVTMHFPAEHRGL